jgi:hypothetical protein
MRGRDVVLSVARIAFALTSVVAMTYQFSALDHTLPTFSHGNFLSVFTIQTNLLAVGALLALTVVRTEERTLMFDIVRTGVTLYIAITGVVFALLLSGLQEDLDTHIAWVDFVVHKLMPIVVVADWLIDPPRRRLPLRAAAAWLAYPALWLAYTLIRGASIGWYPYPFVDADRLGYGGVLLRSAFLLAGIVPAALVVVLVGNRLGRARPRSR